MQLVLIVPGLILLAALLTTPTHAQSVSDLATDSLVPAELLAGPGWEVEPRAEIRGYQARFVIHTDWGTLHADSIELLTLRVSEMSALAKLNEHSVTEALSNAGGERFLTPAKAIGDIAEQPQHTAARLPQGVVGYFSERWQRLRKGARHLADESRAILTEDGSPYDHVEGPMGSAGHSDQHDNGWLARRGNNLASLIKHETGYPATRRQLAEHLGIDPYTSNELIVSRLDGLAWAQTSGRLASGQALALLAGPAATAIHYAVRVNELVLKTSPEHVGERNQQLLAAHCQDEALIRAFLRNNAFSPSLQTALVDHYVALAPANGCEALLETAQMARNEAQARFILGGLRLLSAYLGEGSREGRIVPYGALLAYETANGEFVLPLAVDWLTWTESLPGWFDLPTISHRPNRTLLLSGGLSPKAQRELTLRGWSIVPRLPYPGSPAYRRPLASTH